jgi:hypothetical protein
VIRCTTLVLLAAVVAQAQGPSLRQRMLAAEDARASTPQEMAPLLQGLRSGDALLEDELIAKERPGSYRIAEPFLTEWILRYGS